MQTSIAESVKTGPISGFQIAVVFLCMLIQMLDGFDVLVMAFTSAPVADDWGLTGSELGVLLSAGLIGMAAGSLFLAPFADKTGRRPMILICLVVLTFGMVLSGVTSSMWQLVILRLITGLGIGAMMANLTVMVSEFAPNKWRGLCIYLMLVGYPLGAIFGGLIANYLIANYGWESVFFFGGAASFILIFGVLLVLPESLDFLISKRPRDALERVNSILMRMGHNAVDRLPDVEDKAGEKVSRSSLLKPEFRRTTLLICTCFFMNYLAVYFLLSWTPKLLVEAGASTAAGISASVFINMGGAAGGIIIGILTAYFSPKKLVSFNMASAMICLIVFGVFLTEPTIAWTFAALIGFFLFAAGNGLFVIAPTCFPTEIRATGVGMGIGIGRIGGFVSPLIAGVLLDLGWEPLMLYALFAIPLLIVAVAVLRVGE